MAWRPRRRRPTSTRAPQRRENQPRTGVGGAPPPSRADAHRAPSHRGAGPLLNAALSCLVLVCLEPLEDLGEEVVVANRAEPGNPRRFISSTCRRAGGDLPSCGNGLPQPLLNRRSNLKAQARHRQLVRQLFRRCIAEGALVLGWRTSGFVKAAILLGGSWAYRGGLVHLGVASRAQDDRVGQRMDSAICLGRLREEAALASPTRRRLHRWQRVIASLDLPEGVGNLVAGVSARHATRQALRKHPLTGRGLPQPAPIVGIMRRSG
mmetsp:Transcript_13861/g.39928  ORF Transcript_13861/g.39928 Transcript_13861/m.39928 type:complete len:265 (+) Transcript_13861:532-1326(+)